jgi:hypothetical protein
MGKIFYATTFCFLFGAFAYASSSVRLECRGFEHDALDVVQLTETVEGTNSKFGIWEYYSDGQKIYRDVDASQVSEGPLALSPLYGYSRTLVKKDGVWALQYGCGETAEINCLEAQK